MVVAIALLPFLADWFHIPHKYQLLAALYCLLLPTMAAATPVGVLRALDRFDLLSVQGTFTPTARAILDRLSRGGSNCPFTAYVLIWFVTDLGGDLLMWWLAGREMKRHDLLKGIRPNLRARGLDGGWKFRVGGQSDRIAGGGVGPGRQSAGRRPARDRSAPGIYRISQTLIDSAAKPSDMLAKVFYPEVVRLDLRTGHPWRLMLRSAVLDRRRSVSPARWSSRPADGRSWPDVRAGVRAAYPVLMVMIIALLLTMIAFPLGPMLYALDRANAPLVARRGRRRHLSRYARPADPPVRRGRRGDRLRHRQCRDDRADDAVAVARVSAS